MKIFFEKKRLADGYREFRCCGVRLFSYRSRKHARQQQAREVRKNADMQEYVRYLETLDTPPPPPSGKRANRAFDTRLIAYYLPQFHSIPINDEFHGKGFTEWSNVTKTLPQYTGHYQPHLPYDVGFYDLSHTAVMRRQIELARQHGIYGFCSYYYWFSGKKLLEKPFENYLRDKSLDFPFCFCWVLENWSRRWDGGNNEVMLDVAFKAADADKFFADILPYLQDERWIKVGDKPLLLFYKLHMFPLEEVQAFVERLRALAVENGFPGLYLVAVRTMDLFESGYQHHDPQHWRMDAWTDFPPHVFAANPQFRNMASSVWKKLTGYVRPDFKGSLYDMEDYINNERYREVTCPYPLFQGCFPSWDNSSRRAKIGCHIYDGMTPSLYKKWLTYCIEWTKENQPADRQMVFINAWNEWAEGAHLEPDRKYGYQYLEATLEALEETNPVPAS